MTSITTDSKVLIVEDDAPKLKAIINFFEEEFSFFESEVAKSLTSAIQQIGKKSFDLCIVDMSIPTFDFDVDKSGGDPQSGGGKDILRFIQSESPLTRAIIVTQYDEFYEGNGSALSLDALSGQLLRKFSDNLIGVLFYSSQKGEWRSKLKGLLEETGFEK